MYVRLPLFFLFCFLFDFGFVCLDRAEYESSALRVSPSEY